MDCYFSQQHFQVHATFTNGVLGTLHWAFHMMLAVKNLSAKAGDMRDTGLIFGLGRSPGVGNGNPLQYCCLDRGA